ncbi:hypothetical protein [uncultured Cetobacterium sp.]|uniref:hypothetical protein n=2 Tax=uncultured Cetobacterium sp. TaxID=527638 RepID=UPI0026233FF5|nr:hypothetical protein [uncultured Cetobacterium sp.]
MGGITLKKYIIIVFIIFTNTSIACNSEIYLNNIINIVLSHEGNHLMRNKKEYSKYGIRNFILIEYNKIKFTNYKIETLTKNQAIEISLYLLKKYRVDEINNCNLKLALFDTFFNTGYGTGSNLIQKSINRYFNSNKISIDGVMGSNTIDLLNSIGEDPYFYKVFFQERLNYYMSLKSWNTYGNGWKKRILSYSTVEKLNLLNFEYHLKKKEALSDNSFILISQSINYEKISYPFYNKYILFGKLIYLNYINFFIFQKNIYINKIAGGINA